MLARQARDFVAERFLSPLPADDSDHTTTTTTTLTLRPAADLKLCPFFMVADIFFGALDPSQRATLTALAPLREDLFKYAFRGGINRFAFGKYLPGGSPVRARLREFQDRWYAFVRDAYGKAAAQGQKGLPVVELWEAVEGGRIPMVEVRVVSLSFGIVLTGRGENNSSCRRSTSRCMRTWTSPRMPWRGM